MKNKIKIFLKFTFLILVILAIVVVKLKFAFNKHEYYNLDGEIYYTKLNVGAYSGGIVTELPVKEGVVVKEGDLIAQLQNNLLESKVKGYQENITNGIPYSRTDYFEQLKRIENLRVVSPISGYVLEVRTVENGYVKDSEVVTVLVPLDSIKYSLVINKDFKNKSPLELQAQFKIGQKVIIRNKLSQVKTEATIVDAIPFIKEAEPTDIKTRFIITPDDGQNMLDSLGQEVEVLFVKKTMISRVIDYAEYLYVYLNSLLSR